MSQAPVLPFDQIDLGDAPITGMKAATLGHLRRAGIPVPNGFVVPTTVFDSFVERCDLAEAIATLDRVSRESEDSSAQSSLLGRIEAAFLHEEIPASVVEALRGAFREAIQETGAVVVRSSAIGEDLPDASYAGQHSTVLNVRTFDALLQALRRCWVSAFSVPAARYRARLAPTGRAPSIAVIVQTQIICQAAGTMFTVDPVDEDVHLVVEAVWGLGEALAQGEVSPDRYLVDRDSLSESARPRIGDKRCQRVPDFTTGTRLTTVPLWRRRRPILNRTQLSGLALLGLQIERLLGAPQDVEWGLAGGRWFFFQARPITTLIHRTSGSTSDGVASREWTSGFLDERLGEPVSPLGWSILQRGLEDIAFREPLRMIGVDPSDLEPITRLWKGRPYVNVAVFEALYKLFPDVLLPEDARRFFPGRNAARRKLAPRPGSLLSPRVWFSLIVALAREPLTVSPFHNDHTWNRFESRYIQAMMEIGFSVGVLEREEAPSFRQILDLIDEVERHNRRLLQIHRWSLTYAEVWYSLLRKAATWLIGPGRASSFCAEAVANLDDYSVQLNRALRQLAARSKSSDHGKFRKALAEFLVEHGHRSFSLDVIRPTFADDPSQVMRLIGGPEAEAGGGPHPLPLPPVAGEGSMEVRPPFRPLSRALGEGVGGEGIRSPNDKAARGWSILWRPILAPLVAMTRRYVRLRENQRLTWQRGLALLRRLYLRAGAVLVQQGRLIRADDVFFLTAEEVSRANVLSNGDLSPRVADRRRRFAEYGASTSYPRFLNGNQPIEESESDLEHRLDASVELRGEPVSPGVGRGRARIVLRPDDLESVEPGDVLIARGADPGWTPVFDRLAALVMETGGQLSHASVVAREYRLPAVVGISDATRLILPGENVVVDGSSGTVRRVGISTERK